MPDPRMTCPCCGARFVLESLRDGEALVAKMKAAHTPPAKCYAGQGGGYFVEYGGGQVSRQAINDALHKGLIVPAYDEKPGVEYWRVAT